MLAEGIAEVAEVFAGVLEWYPDGGDRERRREVAKVERKNLPQSSGAMLQRRVDGASETGRSHLEHLPSEVAHHDPPAKVILSSASWVGDSDAWVTDTRQAWLGPQVTLLAPKGP